METERDIERLSSDEIVVRCKGEYYLLQNRCSHEDYPLEDAFVDGEECWIECPKHGARFCIETGEPISLPATEKIYSEKLEEKDGFLYKGDSS
jgi:3-phenylpropionate/trans-cinnamate dioxygenase ferredoxin subunit